MNPFPIYFTDKKQLSDNDPEGVYYYCPAPLHDEIKAKICEIAYDDVNIHLAPAGLNRGLLQYDGLMDYKTLLKHYTLSIGTSDKLYDNYINPIKIIEGNFVIWGHKYYNFPVKFEDGGKITLWGREVTYSNLNRITEYKVLKRIYNILETSKNYETDIHNLLCIGIIYGVKEIDDWIYVALQKGLIIGIRKTLYKK